MRVLDLIDRVVLRFEGPIDTPRVFFMAQVGAGEKETDFSGLKEWMKPDGQPSD